VNFDDAFEILLGHEGGYVNDRRDAGGETKYGISKRAYPGEDIAGMTVERAKTIYLRDYWGPAGCDALPDALKLQVFDAAVNSGVRKAVKLLQRAAGADADGVLGPHTLLALQSMPALRLVARFNGERLAMMADLPDWPAFGRGWARRVAANLKEA
jgi:lysozyme family protein